MKHITLVVVLIATLLATLLATAPLLGNDGHQVRYEDPSGSISVTVIHDITVRVAEPVHASRKFKFDLSLVADGSTDAVTVTIDGARASQTAHEMRQRYGTRHLTGETFPLSIGADGRRLESVELSEPLTIDFGPMVDPGFSIAGFLTDTLPVLPEKAVAVGTTWTTERPIRSLEGWTWGTGTLTSRHRITAVDRRDGKTIVTAETEAEASLVPIEGGKECSGELKRTLRWTFDATGGRLLSLSMEQETEGTTTVPQGYLPIHQLTKVELAPPAA